MTTASPIPVTTGGLAQFQAMCAEAEAFYLDNPHTYYNSWIYLTADGCLGSDTVKAPYPHEAHPNAQIYPICTFCARFPTGLPFMADDLERAYWFANALRIQTAQRRAS